MRTALFLAALAGFSLVLPFYVELNCTPRDCNIKHGINRQLMFYEQQQNLWRKYQDRLGHGGVPSHWAPLHTGR